MSRPTQEPIGSLTARTAKAVSRAFDEALAEAGGSRPTWLILLSLKQREWGTQRELAGAIGIEGATLTHHLAAMERDGLVKRERDPANRRVHRMELTPKGDKAFERLRGAALAHDARLRDGLSQADEAKLRKLLGRLGDNVA